MFRLSLRILVNWASVTILVLLLFLPVYGPFMVYAEGSAFPVTSKIELLDVVPVEGGTSLRFRYTKLRPCEFVGTARTINGSLVDFYSTGGSPNTRSPGRQTSRTWFLASSDLTGSEVYFWHRCSPMWLTATKVYTPADEVKRLEDKARAAVSSTR